MATLNALLNFFKHTSVIYHTKNIHNVMEKKSVKRDRKCVLAQNMDIVKKKRIEVIAHAVQSIKSIKPVVI